MTHTLLALGVALCSFLALPAWSQAAVLYAANGAQGHPSTLVILDQTTGAVASTVGPIGFAVTGLAVQPITGALYGSTSRAADVSPGSLIRINKTTGAGTLIGSFALDDHAMADLTFGPDGTLYGWAEPTLDALHRIDLATGKATIVGPSQIGNTFGSGIAATASAIILTGKGGTGVLHVVNRTTGAATPGPTLDWIANGSIAALAFGPDGTLFGMGIPPVVGSAAFLLRINRTTGHVTQLGPTIEFGDALAFDPPTFPDGPAPIPTLSELSFGMMAVLLAAIALYRMRPRTRWAAGG
jgi:hypothetical protein